MSWQHLDNQMARWSSRLASEIRVPTEATTKLATTIAAEVRFLDPSAKDELRQASPVPLRNRLQELEAFQGRNVIWSFGKHSAAAWLMQLTRTYS